MSDPWVENVQEYLNDTYTGVSGWNPVTVTGRTGWPTIRALIRALQHELGLTALSDNFGPGTESALASLGPVGPDLTVSNKDRIFNIARGAMYCTGYDGGAGMLDGAWTPITSIAAQQLRQNIGLVPGPGVLSPKVFKALLTLNAYVLTSGGSAAVRAIQQDLNGRYLYRRDFYVIPTDGHYSRDVQKALVLALQYELDMADGTANGTFGPATRQGIRDHAHLTLGSSDSAKYFVHLFQAAMNFNTYATAYTGTYSTSTVNNVKAFQRFVALPDHGEADFATWASLLVSTGDTTRPGTAADCITEITHDRAATLISHGYQTVGRYLTNAPVGNPLNKRIQPGELATIFANDLTVFPIFQEIGTNAGYFTYETGLADGAKAHAAALGYGFKRGTTIYFAVDFDAQQGEIDNFIVHYFLGVERALSERGSKYRVGVYGSRNTCSTVTRGTYVESSFVAGMSTGFSGNLGFPLPQNWAFDQILEYSIGSGSGEIAIDKNIQSGRDLGQTDVDSSVSPGLLDVETPASARTALESECVTWFNDNMTWIQKGKATLSRVQAFEVLMGFDELITRLARGYAMRKSLIQTAVLWETALHGIDDDVSDSLVIASYLWWEGGSNPPGPTVPTWDSSTGPAQIFARTAIRAINWGRESSRRLTILREFDEDERQDMWDVWQSLHVDGPFNVTLCALVLLHKAFLAEIATTDYLSFTAADIRAILSKYNNSTEYGDRNYELYQIFETVNAAARAA